MSEVPVDKPAWKLNGRMLGLVAASLLLAIGSVWLLTTGPGDRPDTATARTAGRAAEDLRAGALTAAAADAQTILSYSYDTLSADEQRARELLAPEFLGDYASVMKVAGPAAIEGKLTLRATVIGNSLVSINRQKVVALLFVNLRTTSASSKKQQLNQNRVLMTMTRKDGGWIVSKIQAF